MIYIYPINIPKNTPKNNPKKTFVKLTKGVMNEMRVQVYKGALGLVGVRVKWNEDVFFPMTPETYFTPLKMVNVFSENRPLEIPPYNFMIETYNLDEYFDHELTMIFSIIPLRIEEFEEPEVGGVIFES